uniref:bacteriophage T4 gp5 trimerisation domain-containing protein n=1 Tax=Photorhabdus viridis TaxID=3163327 RepID=UPI00387E86F7
FRSKTHKGDGYNELRFEDARGSEELALHAQRDMNTVVLNDRETRVMHNHTESIGNDQILSVRKNRHKEVTGNEVSAITGLRQITVEQDSRLNVKNNIQIQSRAGGIEIATAGGSITIDSAGNIRIQGANITINGKQVNVN